MTVFTGTLHVWPSADAPSVDLTDFRGTLSFVNAGSTIVLTTADNPVLTATMLSQDGTVLAHGFVKLIVENAVGQVPFIYPTT